MAVQGLMLGSGIGLILLVALVLFVFMNMSKKTPFTGSIGPAGSGGGSARLPCMAGGSCPLGLKCSGGFCVEGFTSDINISTDMSSCSSKECKGINAPCARSATPCPEGNFCQGNKCVNISAPDDGDAYNQIGTLLD